MASPRLTRAGREALNENLRRDFQRQSCHWITEGVKLALSGAFAAFQILQGFVLPSDVS
ncbi:hypothetical protein B0H17DRAFT_1096188 [Mycena rosella]|uniref:Uncharacterized protein n=1 Tax=Mycena rosella TaxID=1033263 RepID=A0AAD7G617_MYCRO|nr:hypothetical protein B0H17DRAFT_1096188 [Mycena rosella]